MTKQQIGLAVFAQIKSYLSEHGHSMASGNFPADFPISRASCYNIRNGIFTVQLLQKLPFKTVNIEFQTKAEIK